MYNRQERNEEVYLYKALKLSGSLQMSEEEKSEQIRKIMEISKADRLTGRRDMVVRRKKASVSGRSTGNGYGNDRNPLYNAVVLLPDV